MADRPFDAPPPPPPLDPVDPVSPAVEPPASASGSPASKPVQARLWPVRFFDGKSAAVKPAEVELRINGISIITGIDKPVWWSYADIVRTQGQFIGQRPRLEHRRRNQAIVPDSGDILPEIEKRLREHESVGSRIVRRVRGSHVGVMAAAMVFTLAAIFYWGIPAVAGLLSAFMPPEWERQLGMAAVKAMAPAEHYCRDEAVTGSIDEIMNQLLAAAPGNPYRFEVKVLNTKAVNAFAAPGGYIVVYRGLLEETRRAEELAGVLAHEIQHVLQRHSTRQLVQQASLGLLLALYLGGESTAASVGADIARNLGHLKYSRRAEYEADMQGLRMMAAAGIDPRGMVDAFAILESASAGQEEPSEYLSTHPRIRNRISRMDRELGNRAFEFEPLLYYSDWNSVRFGCE